MSFRTSRCRRGSVMVWGMFGATLMLGMATVAVDWGRMQVAKSEIQAATDAAVRAAGQKFCEDAPIGDILAAAVGVASENKVDGQSVVVRMSNLKVGVYDPSIKQFVETGDISIANALRIELSYKFGVDGPDLTFAKLIGSGDRTVHHRATVMVGDVPAGWDASTYTIYTPPTTVTTPDTILTETTVVEAFTPPPPPPDPTPAPTYDPTPAPAPEPTPTTWTPPDTSWVDSAGSTGSTTTTTTVIPGTTYTTPGSWTTVTESTPAPPPKKTIVQVE